MRRERREWQERRERRARWERRTAYEPCRPPGVGYLKDYPRRHSRAPLANAADPKPGDGTDAGKAPGTNIELETPTDTRGGGVPYSRGYAC